ncbi:MAG TPA: hypothetical protein VF789_23040 [Thermoanaerobaculia bacterium]
MVANLDTKANRRKLRELAGMAYTRELGRELSKVEDDFARWRRGEIDPFELSDRIHRFHDGPSRDLYVRYHRVPPAQMVSYAVANEILQREEISSDLLEALESLIDFFEMQRSRSKGE